MANSSYYPFDIETVDQISSAFDVKELISQNTGESEAVFVPKTGINDTMKNDGLTALQTLMAYEDPSLVESDNKTGLAQDSNASYPEFYRGMDLGRIDIATEIAGMMVDLTARQNIEKVYTPTINENNIVFVPGEKNDAHDMAVANQALNARFKMVPVQLGDFGTGLGVALEDQAKAIGFMTGEMPESQSPVPSKPRDIDDHNMQEYYDELLNSEDGRKAMYELGKDLNKSFTVVADTLMAKVGVPQETVMNAKQSVDTYCLTDPIYDKGVVVGLRPLPTEQGNADAFFMAIKAAKLAEDMNAKYLRVVQDPAVQAIAKEVEAPVEPVIENVTSGVEPSVTPGVTANAAAALNSGTDMAFPNASAMNNAGNFATNISENNDILGYFNAFMPKEGHTNNSDENEVFFDAMKYAALRIMGDDIPDFKNLTPNERSVDLGRIIEGFGNKKLNEFAQSLNEVKQAVLLVLPPKKLAALYTHLSAKVGKAKAGSEDQSLFSSQLSMVDGRINDIVNGYVDGGLIIDQSNVADVYEGMVDLLDTRDAKNPVTIKGKDNLRLEINKYDDDRGLTNLTPKDNSVLSDRVDQINKLLVGLETTPEVQMIMDVLQFTDNVGKLLAQKDANGNVLPECELTILTDLARVTMMNALTPFKSQDITKEVIGQVFNEAFKMNVANLIGADLLAKGKNPADAGNILADMVAGKAYAIPQSIVTGSTAVQVNGHAGFLNRLATKVGNDSSVVKKLYEPLNKLDTLADKRLPHYSKIKTLAKTVAMGLGQSQITALAMGMGGPLAALGVSAGMTALNYWSKRRAEVKKCKAEEKPVPSFGNFLKRNMVPISMSLVSSASMGLGAPLISMAIAGANATRSVISNYVQSGKNADSKLNRMGTAASGLLPTALIMAAGFFTNNFQAEAAPAVQETTNSIVDQYVPESVQNAYNTASEALADVRNSFHQNVYDPASNYIQGLINETPEPTPAPVVEQTPTVEQTPAPVAEQSQTAEQTPAETPVMPIEQGPAHHDYPKEAHDLAHARLQGEGIYDSTGRHLVKPDYAPAQMDQALTTMKGITADQPDLMGTAGQTNDEILMYKLNQLDKLTGSDMDLKIDGHKVEVGEHFGVRDAQGNLHTPHELRADLLNGRPVDPEIAAGILRNVENGISAEGHFLKDIHNFKEEGTWSYRPNGNPGWTEGHDPIPPQPVPSPIPVPLGPVPVPTPDLVPTPDAVAAPTSWMDKMLVFVPADNLWMAGKLKERIGALPNAFRKMLGMKPKEEGKEDQKQVGVDPVEPTVDQKQQKDQKVSEGTGNTSMDDPAMGTKGTPSNTGNAGNRTTEGTGNTSMDDPAMGGKGTPSNTGNAGNRTTEGTGNTSMDDPAMGTKRTPSNTGNAGKDTKKYGVTVDFGSSAQMTTNGVFEYTHTKSDQKSAMEQIEKLRTPALTDAPIEAPQTPNKTPISTTIKGLTNEVENSSTGGTGATDVYLTEAHRKSAVKLDEGGNKTDVRTTPTPTVTAPKVPDKPQAPKGVTVPPKRDGR